MERPAERGGGPLQAVDTLAEPAATYGLAALILTLPLEFTSVWLHQQLSRFVLGVTAVAFIYLVVRRRRTVVVPRTASVWLLAAYVVVSLLSWAFTRAPGSSSSVLDVVAYPLVGLLVVNLAVTEGDHRRAWLAFLVSGLGVALIGSLLYFTHTAIWTPNPVVAARLNITFGDPNITARFLTLCGCVAVLMFAARQAPPWLAAAAGMACAAVLPLTLSRSGLALFIVSVVLAAVVAFQHRRAAAIAGLILLVFAVSTTLKPNTNMRAVGAVQTLVAAITGTASNMSAPAGAPQGGVALEDNRKYLVAAGLRMFQEHPALGVGFGGYQHALLTEYHAFLPAAPLSQLDTLSHSSLVTVMAEQGVFGALIFLGFLILLAREAWRARRRRDAWSAWAVIPATLIVPIFLYSQFEGRFIQEPYFWLALGLFYAADFRARQLARQPVPAETARRAA